MVVAELSTPCAYTPRVGGFRPFIYGLVDPLAPAHVRYVGMALRPRRPFAHTLRARKEGSGHSHILNWVRSLQAENRDYAVLVLEELPVSDSLRGHEVTAETRKRLSETLKGRKLSAEHAANKATGQRTPEARARQRESHLGNKGSLESRAKQSASQKGRVFTEDHRKALKEAWIRRRAAKRG